MADDTTILGLPLILPNQAQKHVTHNEALLALDVIVQLAVINRNLTVPPALAAPGDRHIVAPGGQIDWAGQDGKVAVMTETGWQFHVPRPGWSAYVQAEGKPVVFNGLVWTVPTVDEATYQRLGVSATPDATNRLSVAAPATLLNHAGAGHQLKLNKATPGDTASLLFQTGYSGRAEMGTAGGDGFSVKVSADGSAWFSALTAEAGSGEVTLPQPLHLGGQAVDPAAPANGTLWLNTTTGEVKLQTAGSTIVVGAGGGGGLSDGDKGDITVSGAGTVWSIDAGAVGLAKLADLASGALIGRVSAGAGVPEALTAAQVKALLAIEAADVTGLTAALAGKQPLNSVLSNTTASFTTAQQTKLAGIAPGANAYVHPNHSGDVTSAADGATTIAAGAVGLAKLADLASGALIGRVSAGAGVPEALSAAQVKALLDLTGTNSGDQTISLTGDVTGSGNGSFAATIAAGAVSNGKLANVASGTLKGRASAGTGSPEDLTGTQATALLTLFSSGAKGLVPASGGGTANFLRADGTWAAPAGGGGGAPLGLWDCWFEQVFRNTDAASSDTFIGGALSSGTNTTAVPAAAFQGFNPHGVFLRSSTTANGGYRYQTTSTGADRFGSISHKFRGQFLWRTSFTGRTVRLGYLDIFTVTDSTDGAYFEILADQCVGKTANNAARSSTPATTLALDTAYTFDIEVNAAGTSARFRIFAGTSDTAIFDETLTTNIPTASGREFGAGIVATEATTTASDIGILYSLGMGTVEGFNRLRG